MFKPLALIIFAVGLHSSLFAQGISDGLRSWEVQVGSFSVHCSSSGTRVLWISSYELNDVGHTLMDKMTSIVYNPRVLEGMKSDRIRLFWLGHECGHAFLRTADESEADCWSAKTGVEQGWFGQRDADQLEIDLQHNPGDNNHPTGPVRAAHVKDCVMAALQEKGTLANTRGDRTQRELPANNAFCQTLVELIADSHDDYKQIKTSLASGALGVNLSLPNSKECTVFPIGSGRWNYRCTFDPKLYSYLTHEVAACLDERNGYHKGSETEFGTGRGKSPEVNIYSDEHGLDLILSELDY